MAEFRFAVGVFTIGTPEREKTLEKLEARLGRMGDGHPFKWYSVERDLERLGPWEPCKRLLTSFLETDCTHALLLPDDALPCPDFWNTLISALSCCPNQLVSLYSASPAAFDALKNKLSWYSTHNGALQITIPKAHIKPFLDFVEESAPSDLQKQLGEDGMFSLYAMCHGKPIITPAVSLIDHQNPPSTQGNDNHNFRRPAIRPYEDMSGINWATPALNGGLRYEIHWLLARLKPEAREKYKVHEIMYRLNKDRPYPTG